MVILMKLFFKISSLIKNNINILKTWIPKSDTP